MAGEAPLDELRRKAVGLLARREHSRAELARKLASHGTPEDIETVIAELQSSRLQSDARFAEAFLRAKGARLGPVRLRQALRQKGIAGETVEAQMSSADLPDELAQAREVWTRKFGTPPADAREWARQARFLQGRGFGSDVIRRLLRNPVEDEA